MKKGLLALALISLLALFLIGCKAPAQGPEETGAGEKQAEETGEPGIGEDILTGDITEVDDLESELSDAEIEDIESSLDEINW